MNYLFKTNFLKSILYISFVSFFLFSCSSAKRHLKNGNYKAAIEVGAKKMRKNPKKADKTILAIETAFRIEKTRILGKIKQLKTEGNPENWLSIFELYSQLDHYQKVLSPVLPMFLKKEYRNAEIELINIDQELADTKIKAAEYLYLEADRLLATNDKINAREAYGRFKKVQNLKRNFRDVNSKIEESYNKGQNHIIVHHTNDSRLIIPQEFMNNLESYNPSNLNSEWTKYHLTNTTAITFDYAIEVHIKNIDISPERIKESNYEDTKKVRDGVKYVLDGKGNVKKDSLGNDITEPKYIEVKALISKTEQAKAGILSGVILYKNANKSTFKKIKFREDLVFQNFFAVMQGDKRALSKNSKQLLGGRPIPFPTDIQMVMDVSELIKESTFNIIKNNENLVYE